MGVCWVYTTLCVRLYVSLSGHVDMWIGLNVGDAFFTVYCLFLCCVFFCTALGWCACRVEKHYIVTFPSSFFLFFFSLWIFSVQPLVTVLNHYTSQRVECIYFQIHHRPDRGPLGYPDLHDNHEVWQTERLISIWNSSRGCHDYQYHCYAATAELNRWEAVLRWQGGSFRYAITAIKIFGPSGQLDAFIIYFVLPENFLGQFTTT